LASNLLCRLPEPIKFLRRLESLVRPGGVVALISPYSWLEEYTPRENWIGGDAVESGETSNSFDEVQRVLEQHFKLLHREDYPFIIREHARKFQWGISDGSYWQRK